MKKILVFISILAVASFSIYNPSRYPNGIEANIISADSTSRGNTGKLQINATTVNATYFIGNGSLLSGVSGSGGVTANYFSAVTLNRSFIVSASATGLAGDHILLKAGSAYGGGSVTLLSGGGSTAGDVNMTGGDGATGGHINMTAGANGNIVIGTGSGTVGGNINITSGPNGYINLINTNSIYRDVPKTRNYGALDIIYGGTGLIVGGDYANTTRPDQENKYFSMVGSHYLTSEEDTTILSYQSTNENNFIVFGGSSGQNNAATGLGFYTATSNATVTGMKRMVINNVGNIGIGVDSPTTMLEVAGTVSANSFRSNTTMNYNVVTSSVTVSTGNINIPIIVNGVTYYIKANTAK